MDGILVINKEEGYTSRDVVNIVSKILKTKKIGHTGTLDPMATGVLVLCIGKCLKLCELIVSDNKEYVAEVVLGISTDTLDITGNVILKDNIVNVTSDKIKEVLKLFLGKSFQEVPKYSAVKVNGKKLYEYARANKEVILPIKEIEIKELEMISDLLYVDDLIKFKIRCVVSKGTYIRSLIRDIGIKLGVSSCMGALNRTRQGKYSIDDSYSINDVKENNYKLISIDEVLKDIPSIVMDYDIFKLIINGNVIENNDDFNMVLYKDYKGNNIALYKIHDEDKSKKKPWKMLN